MTIREITLDGKPALQVDTEEEFARVFDRGLPISATREIAAAFGVPGADEPTDPVDTDDLPAELLDLADEDEA